MQRVKSVLLIVSLSLNVAAICVIVFLVIQQQGRTLRQITGINDSQVTNIEVIQNRDDGLLSKISDKAKIKEFINRFFDGYHMTTPTGRAKQTGDSNYLLIVFLHNKDCILSIDIKSDEPLTINYYNPAKLEYYALQDKSDFIRQLNSFMKTADPGWKEYN